MASLTEPAKLLLLVTLLAKDGIISNNGKAFMKELILRRDPRLGPLIEKFENKEVVDMGFLEEIHSLISTEAQALYDDLFSDTSLEVGKTLSKREREAKDLSHEKSLIYGEVEFDSFYRILRKINPSRGGIFYDLGSGTGKAVFAARLTRDFDRCVGIEILSSLHSAAEAVVARYESRFQQFLALSEKQHVAVFEGSLTDFDWSDGDLVFANSTCFSDELMADVSTLAGKLKPGAIVVTFTKGLTSDHFELLERKRYAMSWGPATVFIHRRLDPMGRPVGPVKLNILPSDNNTYDEDYEAPRRQTDSSNYDMADIDEDDDEDEDQEEADEEEDLDDEHYKCEDETRSEDDDNEQIEDLQTTQSKVENLVDQNPHRSEQKLSPSKIYPESVSEFGKHDSAKKPTPSLKHTVDVAAPDDSFNMLNSPMDTLLLMRKRNSQHAHPLPQHSPPASKLSSPESVKPPPAPIADVLRTSDVSGSGVKRSPSDKLKTSPNVKNSL